MGMPASGAVSFADMNTVLGRAAGSAISLGESAVRTLIELASGAIDMASSYGKIKVPVSSDYPGCYTFSYYAPTKETTVMYTSAGSFPVRIDKEPVIVTAVGAGGGGGSAGCHADSYVYRMGAPGGGGASARITWIPSTRNGCTFSIGAGGSYATTRPVFYTAPSNTNGDGFIGGDTRVNFLDGYSDYIIGGGGWGGTRSVYGKDNTSYNRTGAGSGGSYIISMTPGEWAGSLSAGGGSTTGGGNGTYAGGSSGMGNTDDSYTWNGATTTRFFGRNATYTSSGTGGIGGAIGAYGNPKDGQTILMTAGSGAAGYVMFQFTAQ